MTQMSMQEAFDHTVTSVLNQGGPSMIKKDWLQDVSASCLYRGPEDRRCAAGWHIPDDLYQPSMEGMSFAGLCSSYPKLKALFSEEVFNLLIELQSCHDSSAAVEVSFPGQFTASFHVAAKKLANKRGLKWNH